MKNMCEKIKAWVLAVAAVAAMAGAADARTYKLEGMIGGKYPFVMELEEHDDGLYSGRYAYESTLQAKGNLTCSWLLVNPAYENPATAWTVRDCNDQPVEQWYDVRFSGGSTLSAKLRNARGKVYDVAAHVTASTAGSPSMVAHFKNHIGEYASQFGMFFDPSVQDRLVEMMGQDNFNVMCEIYQTEMPVEYHLGMFWASAFVAHQCCDPAVLWAYDSYDDTFHVWIRFNDHDYWWSETGTVPYKFRELVESKF